MTLEPFTCARAAKMPGGTVHSTGHTGVMVDGRVINLGDWLDDKLYSTVELGNGATLSRPLPQFGELPGDKNQQQFRWPDILRWHSLAGGTSVEYAHNILRDLRIGERRMSRMLARTLVTGLRIRNGDCDAVVDMFMATNFTDVGSEWALAHLIDAAAELAADERAWLAQAWADAARERVFTVGGGAPL